MIKFTFNEVKLALPELVSEWDVILGLDAQVTIEYADQVVAHLPVVPVVELAEALIGWLHQTRDRQADFAYYSEEREEDEPTLAFSATERGWRISTPSPSGFVVPVDLRNLQTAVRSSLIALRREVLRRYGSTILAIRFELAQPPRLLALEPEWMSENDQLKSF